MRVLLLEPVPHQHPASTVAACLAAAGHDVARCNDEVTGGPCRGVADDRLCPLHDHVDLALVVRAASSPAPLSEAGAVCSERRRIPVLRVEPAALAHLDERVERAAVDGRERLEVACAGAVRAALQDPTAGVEATRQPGRVHVVVGLPSPAAPLERARIADRARAAVRAYDPFVAVIDVSITDHRAGPRPVDDADLAADWFVDDGDDLFGRSATMG